MRYLFICFCLIGLASCTINKNIMFKTDQDYVFDEISDSLDSDYVISPNDFVSLRLFTNKGAKLIESTAAPAESQRFFQFIDVQYLVREDGTIEFPEIGSVDIAGYTVRDAETLLENKYKTLYVDPYCIIRVTNNRVIVFPGQGGNAAVIPITNNNTTVIEALALAGGITQRGNASKVKLIRRNVGEEPEIYQMDLSTIEGIQDANKVVQANDIVYVEPVPEVASEVLRDVAPFVTLITSMALIYGIFSGTF
jgi:polysaccharide export outer membrane protein